MSFQVASGGSTFVVQIVTGGLGFGVSGGPVTFAPMNISLPTISGTAQDGLTLTATTGAWLYNPVSFIYQWQSGGADATGAGANTAMYTANAADVGNTLTASVTAINSSGLSTPAISMATGVVIAAVVLVPVNTALPIISGVPQVGQTITATNGAWTNTPTSFAYQWKRAGTPIGGAASFTYDPIVADIGSSLTISVTATNGSGSSTPATSAATATVVSAPVPMNTALPTITGSAQVGQTLQASSGTWTNTPSIFAYQWNRAGTPIGGETAGAYVPITADIGSTLTASVTATNGAGPGVPATSTATAVVIAATKSSFGVGIMLAFWVKGRAGVEPAPMIDTAALISCIPQVGVAVTFIDATWKQTTTSLAYQWKANGVAGMGAGATTPMYIPANGDIGKTLTITVTATNVSGTGAPSTSLASSPVT